MNDDTVLKIIVVGDAGTGKVFKNEFFDKFIRNKIIYIKFYLYNYYYFIVF